MPARAPFRAAAPRPPSHPPTPGPTVKQAPRALKARWAFTSTYAAHHRRLGPAGCLRARHFALQLPALHHTPPTPVPTIKQAPRALTACWASTSTSPAHRRRLRPAGCLRARVWRAGGPIRAPAKLHPHPAVT
ncbi:hypothetical protein FIBSPDRAFT_245558 [Athelia psychrophila]|uniref:Uncharacterized protein n=1 Tax=Athelia psychrophila TaxID=1759441 RepID=A0A166RTD9_9AGAM|nr:hypothetical protein FIBSPDRAFT_245558 [Fibularhizoctonia sp. CBS 109695]